MPYQILINYGSNDTFSFNTQFVRRFLSHFKQFLLLVKSKVKSSDTEADKIITLKLMAVKARLYSFKKYFVMRNNFLIILKFKKDSTRTVNTIRNVRSKGELKTNQPK